MSNITSALPYIPIFTVLSICFIDYEIIPIVILMKARRRFKKQDNQGGFFILNCYSQKLKQPQIINNIEMQKLKYATIMENKKEQIGALKKIRLKYFRKFYSYEYLQGIIRIYCTGDPEVIAAAPLNFPAKIIKKFRKEKKSDLRLFYYLKDEYEAKNVKEDDILPLLEHLSKEGQLRVAYYLLAKISKSGKKVEYWNKAKELSAGTYVDKLLDGLMEEGRIEND